MNIPEDWQSIVTVGLELVQATDRNRWMLGDLAAIVEKVYGESSIKKLATEIRMPRHKTLYDYHRVSKFYPNSARAEFPLLSWSHYREATRLETVEAACELLAEANDSDRPVAWLVREVKKRCGKPVPAVKLIDGTAWITGQRGQIITLKFDDTDLQPLQDSYLEGWAVRVVMYEGDKDMMRTNVAMLLGSGDRERRIR